MALGYCEAVVLHLATINENYNGTKVTQPGFLNIPLDLKRDSKAGIIGNPLLATKEKGERIFNAAVDRISQAISGMAHLTKRELTTPRY